MKTRQLQQLRCPFCETTFKKVSHLSHWSGTQQVRYGILWCECEAFPILEGIVVMRRQQTAMVAEIQAAYAQKRPPNQLVFLAQGSEFRLVLRRAFVGLVMATRWWYQWVPQTPQKIREAWWRFGLRLLTFATTNTFQKSVFTYFAHRHLRVSFGLVSAVLPLLQKANLVVEVGGGAGQVIRALGSENSGPTVISLEKNFWLVYWLMTNRLYTYKVCPIVVNFEGGLPLPTRIADVVMANDTIMYVNHQRHLAAELSRVVKRTGLVVGLHTHMAGQANQAQGNGIWPRQLATWLGFRFSSFWPDEELFALLWQQSVVPFTLKRKPWVPPPQCRSFSFIASYKKQSGQLQLVPGWKESHIDYVEDQWRV